MGHVYTFPPKGLAIGRSKHVRGNSFSGRYGLFISCDPMPQRRVLTRLSHLRLEPSTIRESTRHISFEFVESFLTSYGRHPRPPHGNQVMSLGLCRSYHGENEIFSSKAEFGYKYEG
ncbi:hypothetical protein SLA2020_280890 [Shorea laevis]